LPKPIYILNGPNLNMLGMRQPEIYGHQTLADVEESCKSYAESLGLDVVFRQSNIEGELVTWIQEARAESDGLIINAAAYTHTSVAIQDALMLLSVPVIEVHLSNIHKREAFRHHSYVAAAAQGMICGFGSRGYLMALDALAAQRLAN
jgi:3-dehydroquinate dehydratase-2